MGSAPPGHWKSLCITHLATCPNQNSPTALTRPFLQRGSVRRTSRPSCSSSASSARHGDPGRPGGWGAAFVAAIEAEVDALIGPRRADAQDFEAVEQAVRHQVLGIAAQAMAQRFNADDSDHSGSTRACACGRTARYAGRRPKTFITLLGPLTLERAYYHCDACRTGVCPRDQTLDMQATSLSPATTRMVGLTAAEVSFAKTSELLAVLAGVAVETRQVERTAEALGRQVADDERAVTEQTAPAPAPTLYLGMDGTGVPVRPAEVEGRRGKQPDGSAKLARSSWPPCGRPKGATRKAGLSATPGRSATTPRSRARPAATPTRSRPPSHNVSIARRNGAASTPRPVRSSSATAPPGSGTSPPSSFQAPSKSSTSTMPSSICATWPRPSTAPGRTWPSSGAKDRRAELDAGRLRALVAALRIHVETTPEARKCIHYVFGNRHRMRYPKFRAKGLCISSGVVEAGCKQIGARLKRAGMRWTVAGANAIIALRCCILSGRFEDFWERRAANAA